METHAKAIFSSALLLLVSTKAHATLTSVYDFMLDAESNGYLAQTGNEAWTFHNGDENGNQGDGIDFFVRIVKAGFVSNYATTTMNSGISDTAVYDFGPGGLSLESGDQIAVIFSARNNYLFDHGWWNISFEESARPSNEVPDSASSGALGLIAMLALAIVRRKISR